MVPSISTMLHRFTGEWAAQLQSDAILTVCREVAYTGWGDRGHLLRPGRSICVIDGREQSPAIVPNGQRGGTTEPQPESPPS
jgi:hypothetical protein